MRWEGRCPEQGAAVHLVKLEASAGMAFMWHTIVVLLSTVWFSSLRALAWGLPQSSVSTRWAVHVKTPLTS